MTVYDSRILTPSQYWTEKAACTNMPLDIFFGTEERPLLWWNAGQGRYICSHCPARRDCLLDALRTGEPFGLRGGYLSHERSAALQNVKGSIADAMRLYDAGMFTRLIQHKKR